MNKTRMNELRKARGMTIEELARKSGVPVSTVKKINAGITKNPNMETMKALTRAMGCTLADIDSSDSVSREKLPAELTPYLPKNFMPLLGRVACGAPIYAAENIEGYLACDFDDGGQYFGLRAKGDSMNAAGIHDGDIVVVRRQPMVENGEVAVVLVNGDEATVKRFTQQGNTVILAPQSNNPEHHPQIYSLKDTPVSIIGKVVELRRKF